MRDIDNTIASRLVIQLRDDNQRLKAANDCLHAGIQEYGRMVERLQDKIRSLQQEVDRLSGVPQWERDRDCWDVNDEYTNGYYGLDRVKEEATWVANGVRNAVRYTHDDDGMPISAVLSVRIDRKDFECITDEPLDDDEFKAAIEKLMRRMFDATVPRSVQRKVLEEMGRIAAPTPDA